MTFYFELDFDLVDLVIQKIFNIKSNRRHYLHNILKFGKGNIFNLTQVVQKSTRVDVI